MSDKRERPAPIIKEKVLETAIAIMLEAHVVRSGYVSFSDSLPPILFLLDKQGPIAAPRSYLLELSYTAVLPGHVLPDFADTVATLHA